MKILDSLTACIDGDAPVKEIRQGVFDTAVLTRRCGIAATLPRDALRQDPPLVQDPGSLTDLSADQVAKLAYSDSILEAAIGMATINSLIDIETERCQELNAGELIAEKGAGKRVAVVGHFPFVPQIKKSAAALAVIENNPKRGDTPAQQAAEWIPEADVVAITGTALTNHTLEVQLSLCAPNAFVMVLGPTAPLTTLLFDFGVDAVSGTRVVDADTAMRCISQGANYRQIRGVQRLTLLKEKR